MEIHGTPVGAKEATPSSSAVDGGVAGQRIGGGARFPVWTVICVPVKKKPVGSGGDAGGRGSGSGDASRRCSCGRGLRMFRRVCDECYDKGVYADGDVCSVCYSVIASRDRVVVDARRAEGFRSWLWTPDGEEFSRYWWPYRDLGRCPLREGERVCRTKHCIYREHERRERQRKAAKTPREGPAAAGFDRRPPADSAKPCPACAQHLKRPDRVRRVGAHAESMRAYFLSKRTGDAALLEELWEESTICTRCYMVWYTKHKKREKDGPKGAEVRTEKVKPEMA